MLCSRRQEFLIPLGKRLALVCSAPCFQVSVEPTVGGEGLLLYLNVRLGKLMRSSVQMRYKVTNCRRNCRTTSSDDANC